MKITSGKLNKAQKIIVYGPEGIGKSTFASKFPDPLFIDTEDSTVHMNVKRLDKPTSWSMLAQQVNWVKQNKPCKTLVIDTADWSETLAKNHVIANNQGKSIEDMGYGKGYTILAEEFGKLLNALQEVIEVGIHVVVTAHAKIVKFEDPGEIGAYDRWELKLEKKVAPILKEWADMVLFANYEVMVVNVDNQGALKGKNKGQGGRRVMHTTHSPAFDAKNRHGLETKLEFNFSEIAQHIDANLQSQASVVSKAKTEPSQAEITAKQSSSTNGTSSTTALPKQTQPVITSEPTNLTYDVKAMEQSRTEIVNDWTGVPQALRDLMEVNSVSVKEIMDAVSSKGYFPEGTPVANYPAGFIDGVLIGAWDAIHEFIQKERLPF